MNLATEKLDFIQQILLLDEARFSQLRQLVTTQGLLKNNIAATQSISDQELTTQFHEARRQGANGDTYSTAEVAAMAQQWQTK